MAFMGVSSNSYIIRTQKIIKFKNHIKLFSLMPLLRQPLLPSKLRPVSGRASFFTHSAAQNDAVVAVEDSSSNSSIKQSGFSSAGLEDMMIGFIFGKRKATEVAHSVWKNVVRKGDVVVDATCGNGYDTLAMVRMIADDAQRGCVYAMDVQKDALERTSSLLDQSINTDQRKLVELYTICHTKMEEIVPTGAAVRLVAFNLGYLPGGDKKIKTRSDTTSLALEAAKRILAPGGLISVIAYLGHSGGREEFEKVQSFAAGLPVDDWMCCKLQTLNRPLAPVLVLLSKR